MEISNVARRSVPTGEAPAAQPARRSGRRVAGLMIGALVLLAAFVVAAPYLSAALQQGYSMISGSTTTGQGTQTVAPSTTTTTGPECSSVVSVHTLVAPEISGGTADVAYPADYCTLASYALQLINQDRATTGAKPVALDYNRAAQQHADSMLYYGYFSHWDTQGYKPYMRYSLLGGTGGDAENIAWQLDSRGPFTTTSGVEKSINFSEFNMMYHDNDSIGCFCNNGHRDNILNPLHNFVSIGIAYNGTSVYFDEEFENNYMNLNVAVAPASASSPYYATMTGTLTASVTVPNSIYIAFDNTPAAETPAQLNAGPHEYDPGTLVGGVLPKTGVLGDCGQFSSGTTVCADTWEFTSSAVDFAFALQPFVKNYGPGVYTIYVITGSSTDTTITSISVFVT